MCGFGLGHFFFQAGIDISLSLARALTLLSDPLTISTLSESRLAIDAVPQAVIGQRVVLLCFVHFEQGLAGLPARAAVQHVPPWRCFLRCKALGVVLL